MINNLPVTLYPIYTEKERINYFSRAHDGKTFCYALPVPHNRFIPFQFRRASTPALIIKAELICLDDSFSQDLFALLDESFEYVQLFEEGVDIVTLKMQAELTGNLQGGIYYLRLEDEDGAVYYGELVRVVCEDYTPCNCIGVDQLGTPLCIDDIPTFILGTL